jgi:probable rRNA maturation factor
MTSGATPAHPPEAGMLEGAGIEVDVLVGAGDWHRHADVVRLVEEAVAVSCRAVAEEYEITVEGTEIAVQLTDDAEVRVLNREWRGKDYATNVLSFPTPDDAPTAGPRHLGDIAIAFETTHREAGDEGKAFHHHLVHLAVHGTLHLLGFDHEEVEEAEEMEEMERAILAALGIADPYADSDPVHPTTDPPHKT